ncbi:MAG: hypothetical protein O3A19_03320 [Planctomycetota bacterium]|nr:hypothetical protein [Planctomycetota bacterium]MDA1025435.1 hypothetical protein [Planctomycetota bacterium]
MDSNITALCSDFYLNQKIALTMDIPEGRESVLDLFERIQREFPRLEKLKRYEGECALESEDTDGTYSWVALRKTTLRSGTVNPASLEEAYKLHRKILEIAPYFLSVSPLDLDHLELVFGFDFEADRDRDEIVFEALLSDSPLADLVDRDRERLVEAQPFIGISLDDDPRMQAFFEIKSRPAREGAGIPGLDGHDPISVYLTVRSSGPIKKIDELPALFARLAGHGERLVEERLIPSVLVPIRRAILSRPC